MKKYQSELKEISKTLVILAKSVEKISKQLPYGKEGKVTVITKNNSRKGDEIVDLAQNTLLDQVFEVIRRSRNGASLDKLRDKTTLEGRQLSNALYKLTKQGKIRSKARGIYEKA